jgi:hypothetical protein
MGATGELATAATAPAGPRGRTALDGVTAAWLIAVPLALLAAPLISLLAMPVGKLVYPYIDPATLLPWVRHFFRPEPREQGLYMLSLAVPVALSGAILLLSGRVVALPARLLAVLVRIARAAFVALLAACVVAQYHLRYEWQQGPGRHRYFTPTTLVVGALLAVALAAVLCHEPLRRRAAAALRDSRSRRIAAVAIATGVTVLWMLQALSTDETISWAPPGVGANVPYTSGEAFEVANGLTPFVNVMPPYAALLAYVTALPLVAFGKTLLVYTLGTGAITTVTLLAVYGILRRVTGSSMSALLLYLPFLATSLFLMQEGPSNGMTSATYVAALPLRYAPPLLLAWLLARELDRPRQRALWVLFAVAGLVVLNNVGAGLPAFGAMLVTVAATRPATRRSLLELAGAIVAGLLFAVAAVFALTLARAGALPRFGQLSEVSHYYLAGFGATPLHGVLGMHLVVYLTYVAAIATAIVRLRGRAEGRALTGMLLWTGIYGLGALSYYVVESGAMWLIVGFSTWALAVMLLAVVVVRRVARRGARWPDPAELAVLLGVGVMACSLAQFPTPWSQIERLTVHHHRARIAEHAIAPFLPDPRARAFVASLADGDAFYLKRGAPVAFLFENSHRVADAYGVRNVAPYANSNEMLTFASVRRTVDELRRAGGNTVVVDISDESTPDVDDLLIGLGFGLVTKRGIVQVGKGGAQALVRRVRDEQLVKWVDLRNLHPRALRHGRGTLVERTRVLAR